MRGENVGWDTSEYINIYNLTANGIILPRIEPLYVLLMQLCLKLSSNSQVLFAVSSAIVYTGIGFFILNNMPDGESAFWPVFLFIVLGELFNTMNLLRQSLAIAFGCNIYTILNRRGVNWKTIAVSVVLTYISFEFHRTGILCALIIIPFLVRINRKLVCVFFAAAIGTFLLYPVLIRIVLIFYPSYGWYLQSMWGSAATPRFYLIIAAIELLITGLTIAYIDHQCNGNQRLYRLLVFAMYSFALILLQFRIFLAVRIGYYFELFLILLIPEFIHRLSDLRTNIMAKMTAFSMGWIYFLYILSGTHSKGCVPYLFFWQ